jgi:hypothetical protein
MMRLFFIFSLALFWVSPVVGAPIALGDGESFKFRVGWGLIWNAAEIKVSAERDPEASQPKLRVVTTTSTRGLIRAVYPFDGQAESLFDGVDGRMLEANAATSAGKKKTKARAIFDYPDKIVRYTDLLNSDRTTTIPLPDGSPVDLITSLILTRNWDLKPGEKGPAIVMFDDEFYELSIEAQRYDRVNTPWGDCQALILQPKMDKNPKGMFKKGGEVRVWISQDERRLPVKFEVAMKFGTGVAYLTEYHPPTKKEPAGVADANPRP